MRRAPIGSDANWLGRARRSPEESSVPNSADVHVSGRPPLAGTLQPPRSPIQTGLRRHRFSNSGADQRRHQYLRWDGSPGSPCPAGALLRRQPIVGSQEAPRAKRSSAMRAFRGKRVRPLHTREMRRAGKAGAGAASQIVAIR